MEPLKNIKFHNNFMTEIIDENQIETKKFSNLSIKKLVKLDNPPISITKLELIGENQTVKNTVSDMFYYIIDGEGDFIIDDKKHHVKKGNLVCIPKNTTYKDNGNLKMLSIATPKFDRKNVIYLK